MEVHYFVMSRTKHASLLKDMEDRIIQLQALSVGEGSQVLKDETPNVLDLCFAIERILHFGLRDLGLISRTMMWDYAKKVDLCFPDGKEIVKIVMRHSKSNAGRGRTLLRLGLNNGCLDEYLSSLIWNQKLISSFFTPGSILRSETSSTIFIDHLVELRKLKFDLPLNREMDNVEFWSKYKQIQKDKQNLPTSRPTTPLASPQRANTPKTRPSVTNTPVKPVVTQEKKESASENVSLRIQLEKAQLEKKKLQEMIGQYKKESEDLQVEVAVYKRSLGENISKDLPSLTENEHKDIQQQLEAISQGIEDEAWRSSLSKLSKTLLNAQTELDALVQSDIDFLSTHIPSVDINTAENDEKIADRTEQGNPAEIQLPFEMDINPNTIEATDNNL